MPTTRTANHETALFKPSKTSRKRAMHALQDLGTRLAEQSEQTIRALGLSEELVDALLACKSIRQREARRRQLQRIGKLMRSTDAPSLVEALGRIERNGAQTHAAARGKPHPAESEPTARQRKSSSMPSQDSPAPFSDAPATNPATAAPLSDAPPAHPDTPGAGATLPQTLRIGLISTSDRASQGVYTDRGLPALKEWLEACLIGARTYESALIPDDFETIQTTLKTFCDTLRCHLVLTTGGTGPARRDCTPEATAAVCTREMPGFGEQMRQISLRFVPTAILSRQMAGLRELPDGHTCLIVNLPGQPKAIAETLEGLRDAEGHLIVPGIFAAIPYCLDLIGAPSIDTDPAVCPAFRPGKSAKRASPR